MLNLFAVRFAIVALSAMLVTGCVKDVHPADAASIPWINSYADLDAHVGQRVVLDGFWSTRHEASGIYFGRQNYGDHPKQCVLTDTHLNAANQGRVRVAGVLEKSPCNDGTMICLTVCREFVLRTEAR